MTFSLHLSACVMSSSSCFLQWCSPSWKCFWHSSLKLKVSCSVCQKNCDSCTCLQWNHSQDAPCFWFLWLVAIVLLAGTLTSRWKSSLKSEARLKSMAGWWVQTTFTVCSIILCVSWDGPDLTYFCFPTHSRAVNPSKFRLNCNH